MKKLILACLVGFLPFFGFSQVLLTGTIADAVTGSALPGATIRLEGNRIGTASDGNGNFQLAEVPPGSQVLVISYVGFETIRRQVTVGHAPVNLRINLSKTARQTDEVVVLATRATEKTGTTFTNVSREQIQARNFGQDLPYLLDQTPSVVVNSDAGAGVGYTGIRIRGSDITRINVTVNGIPINDAESHSTYFVNMPDLASSVQDVQIQRGVGTSTNGAGAFGASLNIRTIGLNRAAYAEVLNSYGSFETWRHTLAFGTGLIKDHFTFEGRLSKLASDGYVDRGSSDLKSYYFAGGYYGPGGMLKFVTFSGREKTYQAWNGVPEEKLETDRTYNSLTYENETDNYQQDHYQLHYSKELGARFSLGGAFYLTRGRGYYEQYKENQKLANYHIPPVVVGGTTVSRTDLIRQKWLDNNLGGLTYALNYQSAAGKLTGTLGGGWNRYDGQHFGEVIWARYASTSETGQRYYDGTADKKDFNVYSKINYQATEKFSFFTDLQYRTIAYQLAGTDDNQTDVGLKADFQFFNPKVGATYELTDHHSVYASWAVGNREPVRSDFIDRKGGPEPKPETLYNLEAGYRLRRLNPTNGAGITRYSFDGNLYFMDYDNQLVLTGQLNDVGSPLRTNIRDSYRAGVELATQVKFHDLVEVSSTLTLSRNQIRRYEETVYEYDPDYNLTDVKVNRYDKTDISFSPDVISSHTVEVQPLPGFRTAALFKTVSRQYLDNTSSADRQINGYNVLDLRFRYVLKPKFMREAEIALLVNNVLNRKYEANGYTFGEYYQGDPTRYSYNYYYPQATRNFLASLNLRF